MSRWRSGLVAGATLTALVACSAEPTPTRPPCPDGPPTDATAAATLAGADRAVVVTSLGEFTIELLGDEAPIATANFVDLARCGFYDGITFHRVIAGFVIQAGDPQTRANRGDFEGLGGGGPGYQFEVEFPPDDLTYDPYVVAMANAMQYDQSTGEIFDGTDTNGSQFFITLEELEGRPGWQRYYTILGRVVEGTDVVDTIGAVPVGDPRGIPVDPVIITTIRIEAAPPAEPS